MQESCIFHGKKKLKWSHEIIFYFLLNTRTLLFHKAQCYINLKASPSTIETVAFVGVHSTVKQTIVTLFMAASMEADN